MLSRLPRLLAGSPILALPKLCNACSVLSKSITLPICVCLGQTGPARRLCCAWHADVADSAIWYWKAAFTLLSHPLTVGCLYRRLTLPVTMQPHMQTVRENMASCSGRTQVVEATHTCLAHYLPSRRLQKCVRIMVPESIRGSPCQRGRAQLICAVAAVAEVKGKASRMPSLPFVKVADQEDMKLALMLNVIDPSIGGVLIMGERGTGKSVAVCSCILSSCTLFRYQMEYKKVSGHSSSRGFPL